VCRAFPAPAWLRVGYDPTPLKEELPEDAQPMDTDFTFYVAWEGSDELEVRFKISGQGLTGRQGLGLDEAHAVATYLSAC